MLTTNFYHVMFNLAIDRTYTATFLNLKDMNGVIRTSLESSQYDSAFGLLADRYIEDVSTRDLFLGLSDDNTKEKINDYTSTFLTSISLQVTNTTITYDEETKTYTVKRRYSITNDESIQKTINSFFLGCMPGYSYSSYAKIMMYREVLSEPFILEGNETINFDLTLEYNMPSNYEPNIA